MNKKTKLLPLIVAAALTVGNAVAWHPGPDDFLIFPDDHTGVTRAILITSGKEITLEEAKALEKKKAEKRLRKNPFEVISEKAIETIRAEKRVPPNIETVKTAYTCATNELTKIFMEKGINDPKEIQDIIELLDSTVFDRCGITEETEFRHHKLNKENNNGVVSPHSTNDAAKAVAPAVQKKE